MAKKWTKGIVGLAAIGAAAAGILYMKNKKDNEDLEDEFSDDFEDLDFDLDDDLDDTSEREYVPLNNGSSEEETEDSSAEKIPDRERPLWLFSGVFRRRFRQILCFEKSPTFRFVILHNTLESNDLRKHTSSKPLKSGKSLFLTKFSAADFLSRHPSKLPF